MKSKEELQDMLTNAIKAKSQFESSFHQVLGQIALLEELLKEENNE